MATDEAQAQAEAARAAATGAAVAAATQARTTAATGAAEVAGALTAAQMAQATGRTILGFLHFIAQYALLIDALNRRVLNRVTGDADLIDQLVQDEHERQREFERKAAERMHTDLPKALAIADPRQRELAVRGLMKREERYAQQRAEASTVRATSTVERLEVRRISPRGAYWQIGRAEEHTAGCLFMTGKVWPWAVLDRVYPPRHHGCTSRLLTIGEAIGLGLIGPGDIPDEATAVRRASGIVMEAEEADGLLAALG